MKKLIIALSCLLIQSSLHAQDIDLFKDMDEQNKKETKDKTDYAAYTFKTTRLTNGHTIENVGKGILDFRINHRFGRVNQGAYNLFGLDNASMRMALDYGITDKLMVGIGRSTFEKQFDGFVKYKLLRQSSGKKHMPISLSYVATGILKTLKDPDPTITKNFTDRLYFAHQLLIARKFNDYTSIQLMPTIVHYNIVPTANDPNDLFSLGIGARQRISKRVNLTGEYYYQFNKLSGYYNSFSVGFDIETGGHVFQLHFTNSTGMTERTFITETTGQWGKGDIHFGFNISRVFTIVKPKEFKKDW
ncbi:MAG TPA: hypothetical protein DIW54_14985 [Chitinophagaceae bacterium]|nr:hypothetical protein [Chitinophagaceae bacterium]HCT24552.1 hypothetical protein [Chitinophagaceae bacterium]